VVASLDEVVVSDGSEVVGATPSAVQAAIAPTVKTSKRIRLSTG